MSTRSAAGISQAVSRMAVTAGGRIRDARLARRWTLRRLASEAGLSVAAVHAVEAGRPASLATYARLAGALGLRPALEFDDGRRRSAAAANVDPVHAAMGEVEADHLRRLGAEVALDEPYQHFQFAGRADLVAWWLERRALLHIENRTRFPDIQDAMGRFNAKRAYLGPVLAERLGVRGGWLSETHVIAGLWSGEVIHVARMREATFRAVCPDPPDVFADWWAGREPARGRWRTFVLFDPIGGGRSDRRRFVGLRELDRIRPRYAGYGAAFERLRSASLA
jgi:transcriptional regulator with XRE-family HTH domain